MNNGKKYLVFDIPIDIMSRDAVGRRMRDILSAPHFRRLATVNPEFLMRVRRDERFRVNLLSADIRIPDGFGIVLDGLLSGKRIHRYPGADLLEFILAETEQAKGSLFLLILKDGLSSLEEIRNAIRKRYSALRVQGIECEPGSVTLPDAIRTATVVLCNFGAPEQEYILESLRGNPGNIRLAMGIGGAFDFITGRRKRAPHWMRTIGLEWLFRLLIQPGRIGRIWTAVVVFPFFRLFDRMKSGNSEQETGS